MASTIENILIFVSDSLRWDFVPERVRDRGVCFKTIAQSTYSPPSFATLSTGLYPPQHGVAGFDKRLAEGVGTTYHVPGVDGSYYNEGRMTSDVLYQTFDVYEQNGVADLEPPFWYLERDTTTHAPYEYNGHFSGTTVDSYFAEHGSGWPQIKDDYRSVIEDSVRLFEKRLAVLERLGELENTLVVFTADHGELFGEHGDMLHTAPTSPEVVYVPTIFMHPSLSEDSFAVDPDTEIIEHVDVVTTCLAAIDRRDSLPTEGVDILSEPRPNEFGYSHTLLRKAGHDIYHTDSLWWPESGHVRVNTPRHRHMGYLAYRATRGVAANTLRKSLIEATKTYLKNTYRFGTPPPLHESEQLLDDAIPAFVESENQNLNENVKQSLEDLGYIT